MAADGHDKHAVALVEAARDFPYYNETLSPLTNLIVSAYAFLGPSDFFLRVPLRFLALLALPPGDFKTAQRFNWDPQFGTLATILGHVTHVDFGLYAFRFFTLRVIYHVTMRYGPPQRCYSYQKRFSFRRRHLTFKGVCARAMHHLRTLRHLHRKTLRVSHISIGSEYYNAYPALDRIDARLPQLWKRRLVQSPPLYIPSGRWWLERGFAHAHAYLLRDVTRTHGNVILIILSKLFFYRHNARRIVVASDFFTPGELENAAAAQEAAQRHGKCIRASPFLCNHDKHNIKHYLTLGRVVSLEPMILHQRKTLATGVSPTPTVVP